MRQNERRNAIHMNIRCSYIGRGHACVSELNHANAFAPMLKTLVRKNPTGITLETIAESAICPFHARVLGRVRTDIVRFDETVAKFSELVRAARETKQGRRRPKGYARRKSAVWQ